MSGWEKRRCSNNVVAPITKRMGLDVYVMLHDAVQKNEIAEMQQLLMENDVDINYRYNEGYKLFSLLDFAVSFL